MCLMAMEEPASFAEVEKQECWQKATREEMAFIQENKTWVLTDLPNGHRPTGLKWVYKLKRDSNDTVVKHKAKLVAKGYVQKQGVDLEEV